MMTFKIAFRNVFRNRRRTLLSLLAISISVIGIMLFGAIVNSAGYATREAMIYARIGHIQILPKTDRGERGIERSFISNHEEVKEAVTKNGHVRFILPKINFQGLIQGTKGSSACMAEGAHPESEKQVISLSPVFKTSAKEPDNLYIKGTAISSDDTEGIAMTPDLVEAIGGDIGDYFTLLTTTEAGGLNAVDARLKGIYETGVKEYDRYGMKTSLKLAQKLLDTEGVSKIVVFLDDTKNTDEVLAELDKTFERKGWSLACLPYYELDTMHIQVANMLNVFFNLITVVIIVIILFSIANTLSMNVMERTNEIGTIRAMGTQRQGIAGLFLTEGAIMGIIGGIAGVILGIIIVTVFNFYGFSIPRPPIFSRDITGYLRLTPKVIVQGFVLPIVITILSAIIPARKAARMNIVDALRHV